jgi:hypothetical protein
LKKGLFLQNILEAILNIKNLESWEIKKSINSSNRINSVGESLKEFITSAFLNFQEDLDLKAEKFSWQGNSKNPPDLILKNSFAIEIKKIESYSQIALNSSFPKNRISSSDPMITKSCRQIEGGDWNKGIFYFIGKMDKDRLESLFIVDGSLYSADRDIYLKIKETIKNGVEAINGTEFAETKELGRVNRVDPLGITDLRIRGMWQIENPFKVFSYLKNISKPEKKQSVLYALINRDKLRNINIPEELNFDEVKVQDANNPSQLIQAILIKVVKS